MRKQMMMVGLLWLACIAPASATLVSASDVNFSWTSDSLTGLDWLDFDGGSAPSTVNRTYNDVTAQLGTGGQYDGWRYASRAEVISFIFSISGVTLAAGGELPAYEGVTSAVVAFTGITYEAPGFREVFAIDGDIGIPAVGNHRISQLFERVPGPPHDTWAGDGDTLVWPDDRTSPDLGSWLVRATSPVPIPAAVWLLVSAIGGLGMRRRVVA